MFCTKTCFLVIIIKLVFLLQIDSLASSEKDFQRFSTLVFVHSISRHGDRAPRSQIPGDPNNLYWDVPPGELTTLGMQQSYHLGQWFRLKYNYFLGSSYNLNDAYVQSTDMDRTMMSATAFLAGLYPPKEDQIWNKFLSWQPIPVHTVTYKTDVNIGEGVSDCLPYQMAYYKNLQAPEMLPVLQQAQYFCNYVSAKLNTTVGSLDGLLDLADVWFCQDVHNLPLPVWVTDLLRNNKDFYNLMLSSFRIYSATPLLAKYASGFLLKDMLDRMNSKVGKTLAPDRKFWAYYTHDTNVFSFLNSLGISDVSGDMSGHNLTIKYINCENKLTSYAATIIVELRLYQNEYYVQMSYKNSTENLNPNVINIPGCGITCPLSKMYVIYDNILPKNSFTTECQLDGTTTTP